MLPIEMPSQEMQKLLYNLWVIWLLSFCSLLKMNFLKEVFLYRPTLKRLQVIMLYL